ncbi:L,D-transpeptidase [Pararhodobacter zhoushanensis]|uniref:L,D-transpeptidase n=1 Tax=Pararhodobacter zhoushanensis TaxID=2479545 RepID=A0ABT3GZX0_9RHOB|nr:L,D-transpeptidase [Pararhodobacter zhoushanensis]MCW1933101.1 L,D-transpeptidase [Pararhodobacter zhoushanensis]
MKLILQAVFAASVFFAPISAKAEAIVARVSVEAQTMHVYIDGMLRYEWPVSTARSGKYTPRGEWTPQWLSRWHRSSLYNNAPMPYAIFYSGDYAIHATDAVSRLGRPASAGCVRLHPDNASLLFAMVQEQGMENMRVVVVD